MLREARAEDIDLLTALRNDLQLQASLLSVPRPNTRQRVEEWLRNRGSDAESALFVIADRADGRGRGAILLNHIDTLHGRAELGVFLAQEARGRGLGGEAVRLLEAYAVNTFHLRKLLLHVRADNPAVSLYARLGYETAGRLRAHFYSHGRFHDVLIMEKQLRDETP